MTFDAITVGGGLAGSALAAQLARTGHRVLILERDRRRVKDSGRECDRSNVSGCDQTAGSIPDKVSAVPLRMLQVPRPELNRFATRKRLA
jgi:choline dehydrogenase-like flavoprotein